MKIHLPCHFAWDCPSPSLPLQTIHMYCVMNLLQLTSNNLQYTIDKDSIHNNVQEYKELKNMMMERFATFERATSKYNYPNTTLDDDQMATTIPIYSHLRKGNYPHLQVVDLYLLNILENDDLAKQWVMCSQMDPHHTLKMTS